MRLLFAEDEKSLSRAITAILKNNHYEGDAVYDGEEALAYLECGTYDGAILDINDAKKRRPDCPKRNSSSGHQHTRFDADRQG